MNSLLKKQQFGLVVIFETRRLKDIKAENPLWERVFADWTGLIFLYMF
jgi:hypothetical protein